MKIDWFTVIAQICNLLILIWILKKLLYKPILNAIEEREYKINQQIKDAEEKESEAERVKKEFQNKNEEFERHRNVLYKELDGEVKNDKVKRLAEVHQEAEEIKLKLIKTIEEEKAKSIDELVQKMKTEVLSTSEKVLKVLSDYSIQEAIVEVFVRNLKTIDTSDKEDLFKSSTIDTVTVTSAFELTQSQKEKIEKVVRQKNAGFKTIHYQIMPDLICGIELSINSHKTSWNIRDYLKSFKELMEEK